MRHVAVMTLTGMIGLTFVFLVDAATIFWVSFLEDETLLAALGYAWTVQFFTMSSSIGFMIAGTALVARSLGQEKRENAREQATTALVMGLAIQSVTAVTILTFRRDILQFVGAEGELLEIASDFLLISVPSILLMVLGMISSSILRAQGDASRSMYVSLSAGVVAMFIDPLLILSMGMGVEGAAWGIVISRGFSAFLGLYFVIKVHNLYAAPKAEFIAKWSRPFFIVAVPAVMTQLASPFGNYLMTKMISGFGDNAVAGWAVLGRVVMLTFGGVFALSGAIGGIVGQNYGAGQFDRVREAYRDALIFSTAYVCVAWAILASMTNIIISVFRLGAEAAEVLSAFTYVGAGGFVFAGALFVSNASFNNLGRPLYSTAFNWIKDGALIWPVCLFFGGFYGAKGVVYGQAVAWAIAGTIAIIVGWRFIQRVEQAAELDRVKVTK